VGAQRFRVRLDAEASPVQHEPPRYALHVTLEGPTGPEATFVDEGRSQVFDDEPAVALLHALARTWGSDATLGLGPDAAGWTRVSALPQDEDDLEDLLEELRRELDRSGFDPWVLEQRRGQVRLRVRSVTLA
jgi:hypothetical protein